MRRLPAIHDRRSPTVFPLEAEAPVGRDSPLRLVHLRAPAAGRVAFARHQAALPRLPHPVDPLHRTREFGADTRKSFLTMAII